MSTRPAIRWPAVCAVAAAVVLLADARPASASCGDYVHVRTKQAADTPERHAPPADSPCAHGRCERLPLLPATPGPSVPAGGPAHDAVLTATVPICPQPLGGFADPEAGEPVHVPSVPFHPPRV